MVPIRLWYSVRHDFYLTTILKTDQSTLSNILKIRVNTTSFVLFKKVSFLDNRKERKKKKFQTIVFSTTKECKYLIKEEDKAEG